jgi:hypothetical protein
MFRWLEFAALQQKSEGGGGYFENAVSNVQNYVYMCC